MSEYSAFPRGRRWPKRVIYSIIVLVILVLVGAVMVRQMYGSNLQPVSNNTTEKVVVVQSGASVTEIGDLLQDQGLIRQVWAFERYVRNTRLGSKLQAGTYKLSPSQSVQDIVDDMVNGRVAVDLVTILPGQRIDQVKKAFLEAKFDAAAVEAAFDPTVYAGSPTLADKPAGASLEGFLYPDSYQKDASTDPKVIIEQSLAEMEARLTPARRAAFAAQGLSVFQAVTLASVVEREVNHDTDRAQAAQVFLKRMKEGMPLESDVTVLYGAVNAGQAPSLDYDSPYNTFTNKGLPVGPISNVTESSLQAVANPAKTDWVFFVAGDDGKTYFSRTLAEHEALVKQYCRKLCGQ